MNEAAIPPNGARVAVVLSSLDGKTSEGSLVIERLGPLQRLLRAVKALLLWLAFAVGAVMVPILHWVLVPTLAACAPIMAILALRRDRRVAGGDGPCPICRSRIAFRRTVRTDGFAQACRGCRSTVHVAPVDPRPLPPSGGSVETSTAGPTATPPRADPSHDDRDPSAGAPRVGTAP